MDIKNKKEKELKKIKTISVDEEVWTDFGHEMKKRGYSISEILTEFMKRVLAVIKTGGGEVVFGVEETKKKEKKNE